MKKLFAKLYRSFLCVKKSLTVNRNLITSSRFFFSAFFSTQMQPTAEQIRIAQITEIKSGTQDPTREKVSQLMEMTERSEEDACLALYECDNDVERAVIYLLENLEVGALITTTKKKKNKPEPSADADEFESNNHRESTRDGNNDRSRNPRGSNRGRPEGGFNRGRSRPSGDPREDRAAVDRPARGTGPRRGGFSGKLLLYWPTSALCANQ